MFCGGRHARSGRFAVLDLREAARSLAINSGGDSFNCDELYCAAIERLEGGLITRPATCPIRSISALKRKLRRDAQALFLVRAVAGKCHNRAALNSWCNVFFRAINGLMEYR